MPEDAIISCRDGGDYLCGHEWDHDDVHYHPHGSSPCPSGYHGSTDSMGRLEQENQSWRMK